MEKIAVLVILAVVVLVFLKLRANRQDGYKIQTDFWEKKEKRVMGDFIGRPQAIALLGDISGKKVLEAGCGSGYVARILAMKGAEVYGCDIAPEMLKISMAEEKLNPLGINYINANIARIPYPDNSFDMIMSVSALIHCDTDTIQGFLKEAKRILKPNGILVISISHPFLFTPLSPTRNKEKCWIKHTPLAASLFYSQSQRFKEDYMDKNGKIFTSTVWHHPICSYLNWITVSGFTIEYMQELLVEKQHLLNEAWGKKFNYPAFMQFKLRKPIR
ncbi:MAG: class I SAM-dependent methyltransferase [Candidatus Falkowbacteria bacterium]